jgi:hypothetical protein
MYKALCQIEYCFSKCKGLEMPILDQANKAFTASALPDPDCCPQLLTHPDFACGINVFIQYLDFPEFDILRHPFDPCIS